MSGRPFNGDSVVPES